MFKRKNWLLILVLVLGVGGLGVWILSDVIALFAPHTTPVVHTAAPSSSGGLLAPGVHTEHPIAAAESVQPHPKPPPSIVAPTRPAVIPAVVRKVAPLQVFLAQEEPASAPSPAPAQAAEDALPSDDWAPYGRMLRCHLFYAVDSASINTPVIGVVDEDLTWNGRLIIARCSEIHGTAQVDRSRERIASEGAFTVILHNPDGPGFYGELVIKGQAMDREDDPRFQTFAIQNGSAGIRGMVIKTDNLADLKLFASTFISGVSSGLASTGTNIFGQSYFNPNGKGVGNLSGSVINPTVGGAQAVLNAYAQRMYDAITKDGFFIRAEPGKTFYVYVRQDIDLAKATLRGDAARRRAEGSFLEDRSRLEQITQPRSERESQGGSPASNLPAGAGLPDGQVQTLNQQLDRAVSQAQAQSQAVQARSQAVRQQVDQVNAQAEAP